MSLFLGRVLLGTDIPLLHLKGGRTDPDGYILLSISWPLREIEIIFFRGTRALKTPFRAIFPAPF